MTVAPELLAKLVDLQLDHDLGQHRQVEDRIGTGQAAYGARQFAHRVAGRVHERSGRPAKFSTHREADAHGAHPAGAGPAQDEGLRGGGRAGDADDGGVDGVTLAPFHPPRTSPAHVARAPRFGDDAFHSAECSDPAGGYLHVAGEGDRLQRGRPVFEGLQEFSPALVVGLAAQVGIADGQDVEEGDVDGEVRTAPWAAPSSGLEPFESDLACVRDGDQFAVEPASGRPRAAWATSENAWVRSVPCLLHTLPERVWIWQRQPSFSRLRGVSRDSGAISLSALRSRGGAGQFNAGHGAAKVPGA